MMVLAGRRVVITRPRQSADDFAEKLRALGHEPVFFPTIAISPLQDTSVFDQALEHLACYDWLVLTSANAVKAVWDRLDDLGIQTLPISLKIAAVGPKTASSLGKRGIAPDFIPARFVAEAIMSGLGELYGCQILLPLADIAHDTLPVAIKSAGGIPHVVTAYHTIPGHPDKEGLEALREGVDIITFTSGSTARNFITLVSESGLDPLNLPCKPIFAAIGPKTAAAAQKTGIEVDIVANEYTEEGLVEAIKNHLAEMIH